MKVSILPVFVVVVFAFCFFILIRAQRNRSITTKEAASAYLLLLVFALWAVISIIMGINDVHSRLMGSIPLLWQACVLVMIAGIGLFSKNLRAALRGIASTTPQHWLVFFQALRIGAIGTVIKVINGEIVSNFPIWVGIPDFLFGLSALVVGWLVLRKGISNGFLIFWNLLGAAIILVPVFGIMPYWMNELGFSFIFEFPMILAPSVVVPIFILINLLMAWNIFDLRRKV